MGWIGILAGSGTNEVFLLGGFLARLCSRDRKNVPDESSNHLGAAMGACFCPIVGCQRLPYLKYFTPFERISCDRLAACRTCTILLFYRCVLNVLAFFFQLHGKCCIVPPGQDLADRRWIFVKLGGKAIFGDKTKRNREAATPFLQSRNNCHPPR